MKSDTLRSLLDLDVAIARVRKNIITGCFPNRLDAAILQHFPGDVKARIETLLEDETMDWANGSARFFDLPKQDGLVRPVCYMDIEIAVVYQALVDSVSNSSEQYISDEFENQVLSHRLDGQNSHTMFQRSSESYKNYVRIQHNLANSGVYSHCIKLDIANYYERIYHHKLQQMLDRRGVPGAITTALCNLLRKLAGGDSHGIPQGYWASDYLGNLYLLYLDELLKSNGKYAIRYVDDYRIFCDSDRDARITLKECCSTLREVGLNIQPIKTSIVTVDKLNPELKPITELFLNLRDENESEGRFDVDWFGYGLWEDEEDAGSFTDEDIHQFETLWTEAIDQEDKRTSILSFALSGLSAGESPTAEQHILDNLNEFPHMASAVAKYLISLKFKRDTAERILSFVESGDCIHEWQQMWLLEYFRTATGEIDAYKNRLKALLNDLNIHPLVRSSIIEIISFKGKDTDGSDIKRLFNEETDPRLRCYLLLGFRLLPISERNYLISYLPPSDWTLKLTGMLVKDDTRLVSSFQ